MMAKLKLTVNEAKTRVCTLPEEKFDFLGYTFGRCYSIKTGRAYLGTTPKKRVQRMCKAISEETGRNKLLLIRNSGDSLNRMMTGWANYFCLGPVSKAYRAVDAHARRRLRRWLCAKHKQPGPACSVSRTGCMTCLACSGLLGGPQLSVGERVSLFREPDAGNLPVRFDEREQETEPGQTGLR